MHEQHSWLQPDINHKKIQRFFTLNLIKLNYQNNSFIIYNRLFLIYKLVWDGCSKDTQVQMEAD